MAGVSNNSGAIASPVSAVSTCFGAWSGSRMRLRRCSTSARASGLWKIRCGSVISIGALSPVLPEMLTALSVIVTFAPAQGCSERSTVVRPSPTPLAVGGNCRAAWGGGASVRGAGPEPWCGTGEVRPGAGEPKPILGPVGERQRAAEVGARILGRDDRRIAGRRDGEDDGRHGLAAAQDRRLAGPMDRPPLFGRSARAGARALAVAVSGRRALAWFALLFRRRDPPLDARLDQAWIAAHHQNRIFRDGQRLRIGAS